MKKTISVMVLIFSLLVNNVVHAIDGIVHLPLDGKIMRAYVKGSGEHTIVLLSGWGTQNPIDDFRPLANRLCDEYKVVVLEYFGYCLSTPTSEERSNEAMVQEIRAALAKLEIEPPYILMPHSMSGLYSLYYAHHYPDEVEGIIGIDMSLPQKQLERWPTSQDFDDNVKMDPDFCDLSGSLVDQWNKFHENSEELKDVKYPDTLPVCAFLATEQIQCVDDMIARGEMQTSWVQMNKGMITNPDLQIIKILEGEHYLHHDQVDQIVKLSKEFIDQHVRK